MPAVRSAILPGRVVADRRHTDEQIDVPHDLGKHEGGYVRERQRLVGIDHAAARGRGDPRCP